MFESSAPPPPPPARPIDRYVSGYRAYQRGDADTAKRELEAAVAANPDLTMARTLLGEIYRKQQNYDAAARQYEVLSRTDPYVLDNHYYLGVSYQFMRQFSDSAAAYLRGLKLAPNDFKSNMALGTVYLALGQSEEAVKYLEKSAALDPTSAVAWSNLGVALDARGEYIAAEKAHRRATELDPQSPAITQNLANNLLAQRKTGEAIYFWQGLITQQPTPFRQTKLAEAYVQSQDFAKAEGILDGVLKTDPAYVLAMNTKAQSKIRQYELSGFGDDKLRVDAVALLKRSLALNGQQPAVEKQLKEYGTASAIGR